MPEFLALLLPDPNCVCDAGLLFRRQQEGEALARIVAWEKLDGLADNALERYAPEHLVVALFDKDHVAPLALAREAQEEGLNVARLRIVALLHLITARAHEDE